MKGIQKLFMCITITCGLIGLTGCMEARIGLELDGATSGVFTERVGIEKAELESLGYSLDTLYKDSLEKLDLDGVVCSDTEYTVDGTTYVGKELKFKFNGYNELQTKLNKLFASANDEVDNDNDSVNDILSGVTIDGNVVDITLPKNIFISGNTTGLTDSTEVNRLTATFMIDLGDNKLLESNADNVDGTTHEWNLIGRTDEIHLKYSRGLKLAQVAGMTVFVVVLILGVILTVGSLSLDKESKKN